MSHYGDSWNHVHERALANGLDQCVELHALWRQVAQWLLIFQ